MTLEQIKQVLVASEKTVVSPSWTIHSYRDGEWIMVASFLDAVSTAETYHSLAISGRWGDCLEIRLNGFRVSLS